MKNSLFAYKTKLLWQLGKVNQENSALQQALLCLEQQITACQNATSIDPKPHTRLLPETEMAGFTFRETQNQIKSALTKKKQGLLAQIAMSQRQELAVTMELKRLEKYQRNAHEKIRASRIRKDQQRLDDWAEIQHTKEQQ